MPITSKVNINTKGTKATNFDGIFIVSQSKSILYRAFTARALNQTIEEIKKKIFK